MQAADTAWTSVNSDSYHPVKAVLSGLDGHSDSAARVNRFPQGGEASVERRSEDVHVRLAVFQRSRVQLAVARRRGSSLSDKGPADPCPDRSSGSC